MDTSYISNFIEQYGYLALFIATFLEGMCIPIPSEFTLCFSGYLIYTGHFEFVPTVFVGWSGSLSGSTFIYFVAKKGGRQLIDRWGYLVRLKPSLVNKMERWFLKFGPLLIIPWRQLPVIRTKISLAAGILKMHFRTFFFFTAIGIAIWTTSAVYIGYHLGNKWLYFVELFSYLAEFIVYIIILFIFSLIIFWYLYIKKRKLRPRHSSKQKSTK